MIPNDSTTNADTAVRIEACAGSPCSPLAAIPCWRSPVPEAGGLHAAGANDHGQRFSGREEGAEIFPAARRLQRFPRVATCTRCLRRRHGLRSGDDSHRRLGNRTRADSGSPSRVEPFRPHRRRSLQAKGGVHARLRWRSLGVGPTTRARSNRDTDDGGAPLQVPQLDGSSPSQQENGARSLSASIAACVCRHGARRSQQLGVMGGGGTPPVHIDNLCTFTPSPQNEPARRGARRERRGPG